MPDDNPEQYGRQALVDLDAMAETLRDQHDDRADRVDWLADEVRGLIKEGK